MNSLLNEEGDWDVNTVQQHFPTNVADLIFKEKPPLYSPNPDQPHWKGSLDGCFSTLSAYNLGMESDVHRENWQWLWKCQIAQKIKSFLWVLLQGKTLTNCMRVKRGLTDDPTCPFCNKVENLDHLFRTCSAARGVWETVFSRNWYLQMSTLKLNTDGCYRMARPGGFGGLLRDETGAWICGFYGKLENCTSLEAELWAVYKGLTIILQKGFHKVIIETDATEVVKLLEEGPGEHHLLRGLVADARIIFTGCQCTVQHIYREGNLCADAMAKLGAEQPEDILVVNDPPAEIRELLVSDMVGIARERA
ncbi:unnamed protein product [Camellia sinensis]